MNSLVSPEAVKIAFVVGILFCAVFLFGIVYAAFRFRDISQKNKVEHAGTGALLAPDSLAFATFQQTIRDLKNRQQETESVARAERTRADALARSFRTLIDNLPVATLAFNNVGLVQQANSRARDFFGHASLVGFNVASLFDGTPETEEHPCPIKTSDMIRSALQVGSPIRKLQTTCQTRRNSLTSVELTVIPGEKNAGIILITQAGHNGEGACTDEVLPPAENVSCGTHEEG